MLMGMQKELSRLTAGSIGSGNGSSPSPSSVNFRVAQQSSSTTSSSTQSTHEGVHVSKPSGINTAVSKETSASHSSSSSGGGSNSSNTPRDSSKSHSLGKLAHYLHEMKQELDVATRQRRESNLETQRLREKCVNLEDRLAAASSKNAMLEEVPTDFTSYG